MCYYREDIMSIYLVWKENQGLQGLFTVNYEWNKRNQSKEMKSNLHSDSQNAILIDLLIYTEILIDISYEKCKFS